MTEYNYPTLLEMAIKLNFTENAMADSNPQACLHKKKAMAELKSLGKRLEE